MAVRIKGKRGQTVTLLNPSEKSGKFADELRMNTRYTNDGRYKAGKDGVVPSLTKVQRAYRAGYLDRGKDEARIYKWKKKKGYIK